MNPELIHKELKDFLERMSFDGDVESIDMRQGPVSYFTIRVRGGNATGNESHEMHDDDDTITRTPSQLLIGEHGNNLAAFEHVVKKIIKKKYGEEYKFTLDINDYRLRRLDGLKIDIKNAAKEVRMYRREVPLRPMSSFERRIVHMLLAEYPDITTESIGQEPNRKVVIKPLP